MVLISWLSGLGKCFSKYQSSRKRRSGKLGGVCGPSETMEVRNMLTVNAAFVSGALNINSNAGDTIAVSANGAGNVTLQVNGVGFAGLGTISA